MFDKNEYIKNFQKDNYFTISIRTSTQVKEMIKQLAEDEGLSINQFFISAFEDEYSIGLNKAKQNYPTKSRRKESDNPYSVFRVRTDKRNEPIIKKIAQDEGLSINQLFIKAFEDVYNVEID